MSAKASTDDKLLFTPGPLTTSKYVKQAMLHDYGSRDRLFAEAVARVRSRLVKLARVDERKFTAVIMQGSGTFGVEATLGTAIPRDGKVLILVNGAYGERMVQMCKVLNIAYATYDTKEDEVPTAAELKVRMANDSFTHVAAVHLETTTGILNPIVELGEVVKAAGAKFIVDAMSSFGAVSLDMAAAHIDYLVSSSNKCIEGVPGFSFVIANREVLAETKGWARSLSLDLYAQAEALDKSGQFRFTPPTHVILAFDEALSALEAEGGVEGRARRYSENHRRLMSGMTALGFQTYLTKDKPQSFVITSFLYPKDAAFNFEKLYSRLSDRGLVIYPGKLAKADCFRIGNIGQIQPNDVDTLVHAISETLVEMGVKMPLAAGRAE